MASKLLSLLFAFLFSLAPSLAGAGWENTWPDMVGSSSYSFASLRAAPPNGLQVTSGTTLANLSQFADATPNYSISNVRFALSNFYVKSDGSNNPETCTGNPIHIDFLTVNVGGTVNLSTGAITGGTWYTVTWNGATSVTIPDCETIWSDPLRDSSNALVTIASNTTYYGREGVSVTTAGYAIPINSRFLPRYSHTFWGDGTEWTATPQTAKKTSGNVAAFSNGSAGVTPSFTTGTGWDGTSPVAILLGDSICNWQADYGFLSVRPVSGYISRALDDASSGRWAFGQFCASGTKPQDQSSISVNQYRLRLRALRALPNKPFNRVVSEMGQNGFFFGLTLSNFQPIMYDWWGFWRQQCPTCLFYQTTFPAHSTANNNSAFTNQDQTTGVTDTYPTGLRWTLTSWLEGNGGGLITYPLPSYVTTLPVEAATWDPTNKGFWKSIANNCTVASSVASSQAVASLTCDLKPVNGDVLVLEPGTSNVESRSVYLVTGSTSPYSVTVTTNFSKTHASGVTGLFAPTPDGTHLATTPSIAAANLLIGYKNAGTLH